MYIYILSVCLFCLHLFCSCLDVCCTAPTYVYAYMPVFMCCIYFANISGCVDVVTNVTTSLCCLRIYFSQPLLYTCSLLMFSRMLEHV